MFNGLRSPLSDVSAGARRRRGVVLLGLLAPLLLAALLSQQSVVAEDDYLLIEARIVAERLGGRQRLGLAGGAPR